MSPASERFFDMLTEAIKARATLVLRWGEGYVLLRPGDYRSHLDQTLFRPRSPYWND